MKDHVFQATLRFILGERDLREWDAYIAELEGLNMTQYMKLSRRRTSASRARTADRS